MLPKRSFWLANNEHQRRPANASSSTTINEYQRLASHAWNYWGTKASRTQAFGSFSGFCLCQRRCGRWIKPLYFRTGMNMSSHSEYVISKAKLMSWCSYPLFEAKHGCFPRRILQHIGARKTELYGDIWCQLATSINWFTTQYCRQGWN